MFKRALSVRRVAVFVGLTTITLASGLAATVESASAETVAAAADASIQNATGSSTSVPSTSDGDSALAPIIHE